MIIMALLGWVIESKNFLSLFSVRDSRMADFDLKWVSVLHVLAAALSSLSGEWMSVLPLQPRRKKDGMLWGRGGYCTREVYHENRPNLIKAHALPSHHTTLTCLLITPPTSMRKTYFDNPLSLRRWLFQNSCLIWYNREAEWPKLHIFLFFLLGTYLPSFCILKN